MRLSISWFGAALGASIAGGACAVEYDRLLLDRSSVNFVSRQMNVPTEGRFRAFKGIVRFDPAKAGSGSLDFEIDPASIDLGAKEANDEAKGKDWFHVAAHPVVRFQSTAVKPLGGNRYEIAGKMSIKGRTRELVTPVNFRQEGDFGIFEGNLTLKRADYGIGEGMWATFDTVANEVQVKVKLVAAGARR